MNDYLCSTPDTEMYARDAANARAYAARQAAHQVPRQPRSLDTYSLRDLYSLETQATALLHSITAAIAARTPNLAAQVCGYDEKGERLAAVNNHLFRHVARSRR